MVGVLVTSGIAGLALTLGYLVGSVRGWEEGYRQGRENWRQK